MNDQMNRKEQETDDTFFAVSMLAVTVLSIALVIALGFFIAPSSDQRADEPSAVQAPQTQYICNACGKPLSQTELQNHMEQHHESGESTSYRTVTNH